jgi:hypothetical protein
LICPYTTSIWYRAALHPTYGYQTRGRYGPAKCTGQSSRPLLSLPKATLPHRAADCWLEEGSRSSPIFVGFRKLWPALGGLHAFIAFVAFISRSLLIWRKATWQLRALLYSHHSTKGKLTPQKYYRESATQLEDAQFLFVKFYIFFSIDGLFREWDPFPPWSCSRYLRICTGPDLDTTGGLETRVTPGNQNAQTTRGQLPKSDAPTGYEMVEHRVQ